MIGLAAIVFFGIQWKKPSRYDEILSRHGNSFRYLEFEKGTTFSTVIDALREADRSSEVDANYEPLYIWRFDGHEFVARFKVSRLTQCFEMILYPGTSQPMIIGYPKWTGKQPRVFDVDGTELRP